MVDLPTNKESLAVRAARVWSDYWPHFSQYSGVVLFSGMALWVASSKTKFEELYFPIAIWVIAVSMFVIGVYASVKRSPRISELESQVGDLQSQVVSLEDLIDSTANDVFTMFDNTLANVAERLGFSDQERISLYVNSGQAFVLQGRYSKGPIYKERSGRPYPADQGCIKEAWCNGSFEITGLPDPDQDWNGYVTAQQKLGLEEDVIGNFKMRSRSYAALAMEDLTGYDRIAVLLVESTAANGISLAELTRIVDNDEKKRLGGLITARKLPEFGFARQEEF